MILDKEKLLSHARDAAMRAYSPYSGYKVGAAILTESNKIYTGCNIENASYSLTLCAERSAVAQAVSNGDSRFVAIAVFVDSDLIFPPCGACRQVLSEFSSKLEVIYANRSKTVITSINDLLPQSFSLGSDKV